MMLTTTMIFKIFATLERHYQNYHQTKFIFIPILTVAHREGGKPGTPLAANMQA